MLDIQVIVVENEEQTRINLRKGLRSQDGIEVASEATNGETGLVLLESIDVDVAVIDAHLPDMSLIEFIKRVREVQADSYITESKILVLAPGEDTGIMPAVGELGADSCCLKSCSIETLAEVIRKLHQGTSQLTEVGPC
jgi:anaerobic magnesium-protoporphyrin IX monomethyl ester cyclase